MYSGQVDFVCDYCGRSFTRKYNLQTHIENYHMNASCYCDICDQRFGSPAGLQLHLSRGHNRHGRPFPECDLCGRVFTRKQNIVSHMVTVHLQGSRPDIRCQVCDKTFTTERNLKRHRNQLHNPHIEYPTCDDCNKVFKGKHSLIAHITTAHSEVEKDAVMCNLCDRGYTNSRNLKRHVEMYHGERGEYRCQMCPKVYTSNQSLRRHARTRHNPDKMAQYKCKLCFRVVYGRDNFDDHISRHRQDGTNDDDSLDDGLKLREYTCENCSKTFEEEPLLRRHIKTEHSFQDFYTYCKHSLLKLMRGATSRRPSFYSCEFCSNTFGSVYDLKGHMRVNHNKEYCLSTCNVCFNKFYSRETVQEHKKICLPPADVNACCHCDKLFTDIKSLEFHTRIFHPQAQVDSAISSSCLDDTSMDLGCYKCSHCDRVYYSDRSLKHHVKLKHTTDEAMECELCGKICSNKYYLASHIKIVHSNNTWSKCDYCDKKFKSKRNIRRHIEYTHLGMQRYKCIECETLFKEKRSLRKHVRVKHPDSTSFPQCHICHKRFESAKSCKIHLKLLHSFNLNTHPCDLCSVSFGTIKALNIHLQTKHLAEDVIYKCEPCNLLFNGNEKFEQHNEVSHETLPIIERRKGQTKCAICTKDFSSRKTLKRHIKKFHEEFDADELARYSLQSSTDCEECVKRLTDEFHHNIYQELKHLRNSTIFECKTCFSSYNVLEYSILRYKLVDMEENKGKMILSELCTTEMSDGESQMEQENTMEDIKTKPIEAIYEIKAEPIEEICEMKAETTEAIYEMKAETTEAIYEMKAETTEAIYEMKDETTEAIFEIKAEPISP